MAPGLRPLQLPLLVEQRKQEAAALMASVDMHDSDASASHNQQLYPQKQQTQHHQIRQHDFVVVETASSDVTSPLTPSFSPRGHLRYSSSMSSFDLATPGSCEEVPSSPTQVMQTPSKRMLDDVEEEPFEYDRFARLNLDVQEIEVAYDGVSEQFDLYDCLCDEPCVHRDSEQSPSATSFYARGRSFDYDAGFFSDNDSPFSQRLSRKKHRDGSLPPLMGLSYRIGSRFPSLTRWRSPRKSSTVSSPASDSHERASRSRAASSRSSSISGRVPDRANEPPLPPTPALSFYESSDSITMPGPLDVDEADQVLYSIQRERAQAVTPLLPPMMTINCDQMTSQPSPLQSPTIACPGDDEPQSPLILSPPLSTKPSVSSFRHILASGELPPAPAHDVWCDLLGHANFTIMPVPYKPEIANLSSLQELRGDWETARVNYTKHLVRTGEHYGLTSKTYGYTEDKWAEVDGTWRAFYDEVAGAVVASGEIASCDKFDESIITTVPILDSEGKFPERGDEDIVGPMVRGAAMNTLSGLDRKRPSFWRTLSDRVGLRK
ncbi:hypothetical protein F5Y18DRAFT_344330 [Xylariaceae sp. FL1019]|nr:hypothetical protein F5Y18DRAFT_344330 [Xylariaceae sp. FL1019]